MCEGVLVRVCVYRIHCTVHTTSTFREQGVEQLVFLFPMVTDPLQERVRIPCPHETLGGIYNKLHHT